MVGCALWGPWKSRRPRRRWPGRPPSRQPTIVRPRAVAAGSSSAPHLRAPGHHGHLAGAQFAPPRRGRHAPFHRPRGRSPTAGVRARLRVAARSRARHSQAPAVAGLGGGLGSSREHPCCRHTRCRPHGVPECWPRPIAARPATPRRPAPRPTSFSGMVSDSGPLRAEARQQVGQLGLGALDRRVAPAQQSGRRVAGAVDHRRERVSDRLAAHCRPPAASFMVNREARRSGTPSGCWRRARRWWSRTPTSRLGIDRDEEEPLTRPPVSSAACSASLPGLLIGPAAARPSTPSCMGSSGP